MTDISPVGFTKIYILTLYWSITTLTTIGYGDLSPGTRNEILFVIAYMVIAGFVFSLVMG